MNNKVLAGLVLSCLSFSAVAEPFNIVTVWADMVSDSEAIPYSKDPSPPNYFSHPQIVQWAPTGTTIADWWTGNRPCRTSSNLTWFTAFSTTNNNPDPNVGGVDPAPNTRVQVAQLKMYALRNSDKSWVEVDVHTDVDPNSPPAAPVSADYYLVDDFASNTNYPALPRPEPNNGGGISFVPKYPYLVHGYGNTGRTFSYNGCSSDNKPTYNDSGTVNVDALDVRAVYVEMSFRLILDDPTGPDDRANSGFVVDVGTDYRPLANEDARGWVDGNGKPIPWVPGAGTGRYLQATSSWRKATLLVPNWDMMDPSGQKNWSNVRMEFLHNPPPNVPN